MRAKPITPLGLVVPGQDARVVTQDAPTSTGPRGEVVGGTSEVPARWELPDGTIRAGTAEARDGLKAGAEASIWLDGSGGRVDPPVSTTDIVGAGVLVGAFGWLAAVGLLALVCWCLHRVLERRRYRIWQAEWVRAEPSWHDRSR